MIPQENINDLLPCYDVVIVGAGPVGLATAIALYRKGITNLLVIDQTQEFRPVGQVLDLLPNGLKAIRYIDEQTYQAIKQVQLSLNPSPRQPTSPGKVPGFWHHRTLTGDLIRSTPLNFDFWVEQYGEGRASLTWFGLQQALREQLPSDLIRIGCRCLRVSEENHVVKITYLPRSIQDNPFAHWEMQKAAVKLSSNPLTVDRENLEPHQQFLCAKLVVAADGIHSTIRQNFYHNTPLECWANPHYSGFSAIGCFHCQTVPEKLEQALETNYFQGERVVSLYADLTLENGINVPTPRIIMTRKPEGTIGYLLHLPLKEKALENKVASEIIEIAKESLAQANFPSIVMELVTLTNPEQLLYRAYYLHSANIAPENQTIWSQGRVVLAGDSAHGMPPFTAQGANQGLEDAALLGTLIARLIHHKQLDNEENIGQAFRNYETIRRPFLAKLQEATLNNDHWSQSQWQDYNYWVYRRDIARISEGFAG